MVKQRAKTWKRATSGENGQASLFNLMRTQTVPRVTPETPKTAKRWAKMWKRAKSGKNGQASLFNLMRTQTVPRVTPETPENS
jgi:hypothetical protein